MAGSETTTYQFTLTQRVTDVLRARVEFTKEELDTTSAAIYAVPFDQLNNEYSRVEVLEALMGGDIDFQYLESVDSDPIEIVEVEEVSA